MDRLSRLPGFRARGKNQYEACCPGHDDRKASLSIGRGQDGRVLLDCKAGCDVNHVVGELGLEMSDLFMANKCGNEQKSHIQIVAAYDYRDETGALLFQVVRFSPKEFRQRRPNGMGGWIWNLEGVKRVPYNLRALLEADSVWIPEGEKDVESLRGIHLTATCNAMGAGKWTPQLSRHFRAHQRVTIIADNDDAGRNHAREIAASLYGKVASVKILELAGLPPKGDVSDWLVGRDLNLAAEELCLLAEAAPEWMPGSAPAARRFERIYEQRYRLVMPGPGIVIEADRLRRNHHELLGELAVRRDQAGPRTFEGSFSIADFNFSSARSRKERANILRHRSNADLDWEGFLEEFCQRVLAAEREGLPAVDLRTLGRPTADDMLCVEGIRLPRRHATIIFGDGGAAKSYTGLYLAGTLAQKGVPVALFDWELCGEDHRDRLERIFGTAMPRILYARCEKSLIYEVDRLRRITRDDRIEYAVYDSIAFACAGAPESAEVAGDYFRAVRQIGVGSLHIAHVSKADGADQKPFGSVFWHNGARCTYYMKVSNGSADGMTLAVGLYHRKANLGGLLPPTGFEITFTPERTTFQRADPGESPYRAEHMTIKERMIHLLRGGDPKFPRQIAEELGARLNTVEVALSRHKKLFTTLPGGKVALLGTDKA